MCKSRAGLNGVNTTSNIFSKSTENACVAGGLGLYLRSGITVHVRPELVVEIALDGVQASTKYPGGVALRFARVKGYRADKAPEEADVIDTVRSMR